MRQFNIILEIDDANYIEPNLQFDLTKYDIDSINQVVTYGEFFEDDLIYHHNKELKRLTIFKITGFDRILIKFYSTKVNRDYVIEDVLNS